GSCFNIETETLFRRGSMRISNSRIMAALLSGSAVFVAAPASAQDAPASRDTVAEEGQAANDGTIVVTARRREEQLNDVPVAVTAFTGEALAARGALDITDISAITPNTTLETSRGTNSTLSAFIRGVGQQDPVP